MYNYDKKYGELLTTQKVAKIANVSAYKVRSDMEADISRIFCVEELLPKVRFTEQEAREYSEWVAAHGNIKMDFDMTQDYRFLPTSPRVPKFIIDPKKYSGGIILAISKKGDFININRMKKITPYQTGNGHLQVALHNGLQPCAHDLVNLVWNDNGKFKPHVHHINGNKTDNRAANLISLTVEEHKHAHKLMDAIKTALTKEEKAVARKVYRDFIKEMRADNKELYKEDLRVIDDLDYPGEGYMFVTQKSWEKYLESGNEYDLVIRGQHYYGKG